VGKTFADFTMSLDGFIAGPGDDVGRLFQWYAGGDTDFQPPGSDRVFRISRASAGLLREAWGSIGAIVTGRRDFDVSAAWGGQSPLGVPIFIVTHHAPQEWLTKDSPFTFVTDGVRRALEQAKAVAGDRDVAVSGSQIVQQCLTAGLLDEIQINLAPILLGSGIRLFDNLGIAPIQLESTGVIAAPGVTHLRYRVVK
jgi:dihydrofolate reductase